MDSNNIIYIIHCTLTLYTYGCRYIRNNGRVYWTTYNETIVRIARNIVDMYNIGAYIYTVIIFYNMPTAIFVRATLTTIWRLKYYYTVLLYVAHSVTLHHIIHYTLSCIYNNNKLYKMGII